MGPHKGSGPVTSGKSNYDGRNRSMTIDELANDYWDRYLEANPSYATLVGDHRYDDRLEDLSDASLDEHALRLRDLRTGVEEARTNNPQDGITRALLLSVIDNDLTEHDTEILISPVDAYLGPHSGLLRAAAQTRAMTGNQANALAIRYRQTPRLFAQALTRHRRHVAEGK